jgi:HPt (histidine-containing phosphotransfer) domain-containing protein
MDDYLSKPIEPLDLYACLERPWAGSRETRAAAAPAPAVTTAAAPAAPAAAMVFNRALALERARGKRDLLALMAQSFIATAPEVVSQLHSGLEGPDAQLLERAAHRVKGAAATLAADATVQAAGALEAMARRGSQAGLEELDSAARHLALCIDELAATLAATLELEK